MNNMNIIAAGQATSLPLLDVEATRSASHPVTAYLLGLNPTSQSTMEQALRLAASTLTGRAPTAELLFRMPWHLVRREHMLALRALLAREKAAATVNKVMSSMRGLLHEVWANGAMTSEDYRRAVDAKGVRGSSLLRGRALGQDELGAIFRVCAYDSSPRGRRDAGLVALMYGAGPRRSEVSALQVEDYSPATGAITIRGGKGRKDRVCFAGTSARRYIDAWIETRGVEPGPLFCPVSKSGKIVTTSITPQAILLIYKRLARQAGIRPISPHDMRRSFISDLISTADLAVCSRLCGHASPKTTMVYDRRDEKAGQAAVEALVIPE